MAATGWQAHTVRGTFAGAIKKTPGLKLTSGKAKGGDRIYRVQARPDQFLECRLLVLLEVD